MSKTLSKMRAAAVGLTLLVLGGCATDRQVIQQAEDTHVELESAIIQDPELSGYLETVGSRIVEAAREASSAKQGPDTHFEKGEDNSWMFTNERFHLVNSKTLNAFTTGGSHMYIYAQLMTTCRSEDELAAVMAHEYAHVYSRHVKKGMNRQYTSLAVSAGAGLVGFAVGGKEHGMEYGSLAFVSTSAISSILGMGYTRADEAEADEWGFEFYAKAGWDPARFGDFFQQLIDQGLDKTPELASDHPSLKSRVEAAQERAAKLPPEAVAWRKPPVADAAAFEALKARVAEISATMKTSNELATAQTLLSAVPSCVTAEDQPDQKQAQETLARALESAPARKGTRK